MSREQNILIGKHIEKVWIAADRKALRFDVEGGKTIVVRAHGACCSSSWIEGIDAPNALLGVVRAVEDLDMPDLGSVAAQGEDKTSGYDPECISYYGCKITTDKGACVIDYRNESNGYYGGNLVWPETGYNRFYGGVYGQNVSKEDWRDLAESSR